jgi:predicted GNAT family N-acyltransferase
LHKTQRALFCVYSQTNMEYTIHFFGTQHPFYAKALALRYAVLRKPLGLEFTDAELKKDEADTHVALIAEQEEVKACLTLTFDSPGSVKVRQVAVSEKEQGKGLGRKLSVAAEKHVLEKGVKLMYCNARKTAVPFYLQLGFEIVGEEFEEVGIPHFRMQKTIC